MDCMVLGEKMKLGDMSSPAAMGDGSVGAAGLCPSVSSRGSPPSSAAVEKLAGAFGVMAAGLPVSLCTTVMNSCGLACTTFGVFSYTITGAFLLEELDGLDAGDEPRDDDDTFSGCGRGPRSPLLDGDAAASEDGMAMVMVMAASSFSMQVSLAQLLTL